MYKKGIAIQAFILTLLSTTTFSQRLNFFTVCQISISWGAMVDTMGKTSAICISRLLENVFLAPFLTLNDTFSIADNHHFPQWISWFGDKVHKIPSPKIGA